MSPRNSLPGWTGPTPAAAVEDALRGGTEDDASSFEARRKLDDAAYRGTVADEPQESAADEMLDTFVDPLG